MMTTSRLPLRGKRRGFVLLEILVVIALIGLLVSGYFVLRGGGGHGAESEPQFPGEAQTLPGKAIQKGKSVECINNLSQLRQMLQMETIDTGIYPLALDPNWGVALKCPVSGYAYGYDPASGQVYCPTPGHQNY